MELLYRSTRGSEELLSASAAIIKGLSDDGGLFMPTYIPKLSCSLGDLKGLGYKEIAYIVMKEFFTDFSEEELKFCIENAYDEKFDTEEVAPLRKVGEDYFLELFHGSTIAFKDMALSILPYLMTTAMKKNNIKEEVVILTATSGDTGKAALAGFANGPGTRIVVFYPKGGVSRIQELQMITQEGDNTKVVGVKGNFDDCQSMVKQLFSDEALREELKDKGYIFSSANSINIGRLFPQVAYYVYSYAKLLSEEAIKEGEEVTFVVPTGNFGNILAGFFAKEMGIPVKKFVCASNDNKVLYDFFETGVYDKNREFILTTSPSMDILISSNLERLIYLSCDCDADKNAQLMNQLSSCGKYTIDENQKSKLKDFVGYYANLDDVSSTIKKYYEDYSYVCDPHTAVAACAKDCYKKDTAAKEKCVVVSTASPYKFVRTVVDSIINTETEDDFELIDELTKLSKVKIPDAVNKIRNAPIRHKNVCSVEDMVLEVKDFLD